MLSRRGFFGALAALVVAPRPPLPATATAALVEGIHPATFAFWRTQQPVSPHGFDQLRAQLADVYGRCARG